MDPYIRDKDVSFDTSILLLAGLCLVIVLHCYCYVLMLQDDDSEDLQDLIINPNDSVIVYACTEDDVSYLEVS